MIERIVVEVDGYGGMEDITKSVAEIVRKSGKKEGVAVVFAKGSTAAITTIEFEPGLRKDLPAVLKKHVPYEFDYEHHKTWGDDNGAAHILASIVGSSITVPFKEGKLLLGTWQQIVVINFDTRKRTREVWVAVL